VGAGPDVADPLRVLIVEDCERDAELLALELRRGGYRVSSVRVYTADAMRRALEDDWDLILSDYSMPQFSGIEALRVLRQSGRDIPFIIVSSAIGEETAVHALKEGAHDFVLKDRLARLLPAIERERREVRIRRERLAVSALLDNLYETAPIGLAFVDRELRFVRINETLAAINGMPAAAHIGRRIRDVLPSLGDTIEARYRNVFETGQALANVELSGETPAAPGQGRHWLVNYYPVFDAHRAMLGVGAVVVEVTERRRAEAERERLVAELAQAVDARDEFLAIASHELRTPLTSLRLHNERLLRRYAEFASGHEGREWLKERVEGIAEQGNRLQRLVGELLDVSRIASGQLHLSLEPVDLAAAIREVQRSLIDSADLAHSGCTLTVDLAPGVVGRWDRLRVEQIVQNLLSNALKYGAGKPVVVTTTTDGSTATLVVQDQGIGLAQADRDRIFGRFERAVSSQHYGGLGMGLFIVRQVVEAHGGSIEIQSQPDQGAKFIVRLPLAGPHREP
jgi:PAS domain S-box-containing protein